MESHDELLEAAISAHREYKATIEAAKEKRRATFAKAIRGTVTATELAKGVGMSSAQVARIARGQTH